MPNNWKILDGVNYIAKASGGAVLNAVGGMETPKILNNTAIVAGKNVFAAGTYMWPANYAPTGFNYDIVADGHVRFLGDGATINQAFGLASGNNSSVSGIYFEQWQGMNFGQGGHTNWFGCTFDFLNAGGSNSLMGNNNSGNGIGFYSCVFINVGISGITGNAAKHLFSCLFLGNTVLNGTLTSIQNCYVGGTSAITLTNGGAFAFNSNVDPGISFAASRGVRVGTGGAWGTGTNGMQLAPQFNNAPFADYTLRTTSPHITFGIGPLGIASSYTFTSNAGAADVSTINTSIVSTSGPNIPIISLSGAFTVNAQGALVIKLVTGGTGFSTLITGAMVLKPDARAQLTSIGFLGGLNMDTDFMMTDTSVSKAQNTNVPDFNNGVNGGAERKPNRLSWRIRWSDLAAPDTSIASHWTTGTTWVEMELFVLPTYNLTGSFGNASSSFVLANALPVLCRSWQLEITMRDNYGV